MGWVFPFTAEELQVFLQEADEQLQTLEGGLLDLEREGASPELLAAIFRAAHTLKGSAGTVGHEPMIRLTHALEGVLDELRSGRIAPSADLADILLDAVDRLGRIRQAIASGQDEVDVDAAVQSLASAVGAGRLPVQPEPGPAGGSAAAADAEPGTGADAGRGPVPTGVVDRPRVVATVFFSPDCQMLAIRAYQAVVAAQECGQLVESRPSVADIERERVADRLELHVAGCEGESLLRALRGVPEVADVRLAAEPVAVPPAPARAQQTVRVDVTVLDNLLDLVGELVIDRTRLAQAIASLDGAGEDVERELGQVSAHLWRITSQLRDEVMHSRLLPVESLFRKFPRLVRDAARQLGKEIEFVMEGQETELDRSVLEEIGDPLVHLLRNSVDHGIESPEVRRAGGKPQQGRITLSAEHRENRIVIQVLDDGAGIDPERVRAAAVDRGLLGEEAARRLSREEVLDLIFASGFTTKAEATSLSGRGVGMDVVRKNIERLNGSISLSTETGRGTAIAINLPLTLAIVRALTVCVGDTVFALPLHAIVETQRLDDDRLGSIQGREVVRVRGQVLPLIRGRRLLGLDADGETPVGRPFVHLLAGNQPVALVVDALLGEQEVVIKALDRRMGTLPGIAGAAILGDGRVALILDPGSLLKHSEAQGEHQGAAQVA